MRRVALILPSTRPVTDLVANLLHDHWTPVFIRPWNGEQRAISGALDRVAELSDFDTLVDCLNGCSGVAFDLNAVPAESVVVTVRTLMEAARETGLAFVICGQPSLAELSEEYVPGSGTEAADLYWFALQECLRFKADGMPVSFCPAADFEAGIQAQVRR